MKSLFESAGVVVAGALLGTFLGNLAAMALPQGRFHDLFANEISAGLHPAHLDLKVIDLTFGCLFHLNVMSVFGIVLAALLYKRVLK